MIYAQWGRSNGSARRCGRVIRAWTDPPLDPSRYVPRRNSRSSTPAAAGNLALAQPPLFFGCCLPGLLGRALDRTHVSHYRALVSRAVVSGNSPAFFQPESGSYVFIELPIASVSFPRSR